MTIRNHLILFLVAFITAFILVFIFYKEYTDVGTLNLNISEKNIIQTTQKVLSEFEIPISLENISIELIYEEEIADKLSEVQDYQNLKRDAPYYLWHVTLSNRLQERQTTIKDSDIKNNQKSSPPIELKIDEQLNLRQLFIPGRYFRDYRANKSLLKTDEELIEKAQNFIKKNSHILIPVEINPTISSSGLSGTEGVEISWIIPFDNSNIVRQVSINFVGNHINRYADNIVFPGKELAQNSIERIVSAAAKVILLILALIMLLNLYRQIRFGYGDFKRSFWLGLLVTSGLILSQFFNNIFIGLPLNSEILPLLYTIVVGLGVSMLYLTVEPLIRSQWPQKLQTMDILLSGVVLDRQVGRSIINGATIGLMLICISILICLIADLASLNMNLHIHDFVKIMNVEPPSLAIIRGLLWRVPLVTLTYFTFVPAFLYRLKLKPVAVIILSGLLFTLSIEPLFILNVYPISIVLAFITGVILIILFYKKDIVSVIIAVAVVFVVLRTPAFIQSGVNEYFYSGLIGILLIAIPIIIAVISVLMDKVRSNKMEYLPLYLKKLSEKAEMEKELQMAQSIQEHLQPRFPKRFGNMEFSSLFQPGQEVGGDSYDFIQISDESFLVVVFDISGHGFASALLASHLQAKIRVYAKYEKRLDLILHELNQYLCKETPKQIFASMFIAIGSKNGIFKFSSAGHNPPILIARGKDVRLLNPTGIGLGITSKANYAIGQFTLEPTSSLLIYTDGITEAKNINKQEFGEEALIRLFKEQKVDTDFILALQDELRNFTVNGVQQDDQTLFLIQHK